MPDDSGVLAALEEAESRFRDARNQTHEHGLDPDTPDVTQLRKACRLLNACRTLRENDGYHTSVIEMCFTAIERTVQFYILESTNDSLKDYQSHEEIYERGAQLNLYTEETRDRLLELWRNNRSATYYRNTVATEEQADAMFGLATEAHRHVRNFASHEHECICGD